MNVPTDLSSSSSNEPNEYLDRELSDLLEGLGFQPDLPVFRCRKSPCIDSIKEALFCNALYEELYKELLELQVSSKEEDEEEEKRREAEPNVRVFNTPDITSRNHFFMVVELAQIVFPPQRGPARPVAPREWSSWYVRGYLYKTPFDSYLANVRVHLYLDYAHTSEVVGTYLQFVPLPARNSDDGQLFWGRESPWRSLGH